MGPVNFEFQAWIISSICMHSKSKHARSRLCWDEPSKVGVAHQNHEAKGSSTHGSPLRRRNFNRAASRLKFLWCLAGLCVVSAIALLWLGFDSASLGSLGSHESSLDLHFHHTPSQMYNMTRPASGPDHWRQNSSRDPYGRFSRQNSRD